MSPTLRLALSQLRFLPEKELVFLERAIRGRKATLKKAETALMAKIEASKANGYLPPEYTAIHGDLAKGGA